MSKKDRIINIVKSASSIDDLDKSMIKIVTNSNSLFFIDKSDGTHGAINRGDEGFDCIFEAYNKLLVQDVAALGLNSAESIAKAVSEAPDESVIVSGFLGCYRHEAMRSLRNGSIVLGQRSYVEIIRRSDPIVALDIRGTISYFNGKDALKIIKSMDDRMADFENSMIRRIESISVTPIDESTLIARIDGMASRVNIENHPELEYLLSFNGSLKETIFRLSKANEENELSFFDKIKSLFK